MYDLFCTTTPRRKSPILKTFPSLRRSGFNQMVHIFSEPNSVYPPNIQIHENLTPKGAFLNFYDGLKWMHENTTEPYIIYFQDDILVSRKAKPILDTFHKQGLTNLYLANHDGNIIPKRTNGFYHYKEEFLWGQCLFTVMQRQFAEWFLIHPFTIHHLEHGNGKHIDVILNRVANDLQVNTYVHCPSLIQHIGQQSTVGHYISWVHNGFRYS